MAPESAALAPPRRRGAALVLPLLALAVFAHAAPSPTPSSPRLPLLSSSANFEVRLLARTDAGLAELPTAALAPRNRRVAMRSAEGVPFTCFVPPASDGAGDAAAPAAPEEDARVAKARAAASLLEQDEARRCLISQPSGSFWSFEVCAGLRVRQFRTVPNAAHGVAAAMAPEAADVLVAAAAAAAAAAAPQHAPIVLGEHEPGVDALVSSAAGSLQLSQSFGGGTGGRRTHVLYECEPPGMAAGVDLDVVSVVESPPLTYTILVGSRSAQLCELLPSVSRLVAPVNRSCFEHTEGWWTYEICFGLRLRQYHTEQGTGKAVQESLIGAYDWQQGERLQATVAGLAPAVTQHYHLGTPCEVRDGAPREAFVRFECMPQLPTGDGGAAAGIATVRVGPSVVLTLVSIREAPSCVYTVTLGTALVCEHPDVSPSRATALPAPPTVLYCIADEEDEEAERAAAEAAAEAAESAALVADVLAAAAVSARQAFERAAEAVVEADAAVAAFSRV